MEQGTVRICFRKGMIRIDTSPAGIRQSPDNKRLRLEYEYDQAHEKRKQVSQAGAQVIKCFS